MKTFGIALKGGHLAPTVSYLSSAVNIKSFKWESSIAGIVSALEFVSAKYVKACFYNFVQNNSEICYFLLVKLA